MPFVYLAYISLFVLGLSDNIRGPTFPDLTAQFALSDFSASFFFSVSCVAGIFGSLFAPKLIHRLGEMGTLRLAHALMAGSQVGIFLVHEFYWVLFFAAFFGFSLALMGVCENSLVLHYAEPKKMQRFQAGLHSMYALSSFIAPLVVTATYQYQRQWQNPYLVIALFGFVFVAILFFVKERKSQAEQDLLRSSAKMESSKEGLFFACALSLYVGAELLISTRLALFAQRQWQSDFQTANYFVSMFFFFLLVGRFCFIFWQPKGRLRNHIWLCLSLSFISLLLGLTGWKWGLSLAGLFMAPVYPLMMTAAGKMFPKQIYQVTSHAVFMSNVSVLLMHGLFGRLSDLFGIQVAMWGAVFLTSASILLICLHPVVFKRSYP